MSRRILRFVGGLAIGGAAIGLKFYNKSSDHDDIKAQLVKTCADDKACTDAVAAHFDECFDAHYDLGGRHREGGLKADQFLKCFNEKSGASVFSAQEEEATPELSKSH